MHYRRLGKSDLKVSVVGFGCWPIVGGFNWGEQAEKDSLAALRKAYELGVNFFDTAEGYGNGYSEQLIAKGLSAHLDNVIIASKVSKNNLAPSEMRKACEKSLRHLNREYIDLYQIHWPNPDIRLEDSLECMKELRDEGKIRFAGVSNFGLESLFKSFSSDVAPVSNQVAYNLLFRAPEWEILPFCRDHDISILPYCPIMQGLLSGKYNSPEAVPEDRARTRHFSSARTQAQPDQKS